jgi:hypothetical protein
MQKKGTLIYTYIYTSEGIDRQENEKEREREKEKF